MALHAATVRLWPRHGHLWRFPGAVPGVVGGFCGSHPCRNYAPRVGILLVADVESRSRFPAGMTTRKAKAEAKAEAKAKANSGDGNDDDE